MTLRRAELPRDLHGVIVTCEHAGNDVPEAYATLFDGADDVLASHRGWDPGSLGVGLTLAERLHAPLLVSRVTRLLVDLNRSLDNPTLLSEFSSGLDASARAALLAEHYHPHREAVERLVAGVIGSEGRCVHLAVHSFVDELDGRPRPYDIGLLFDPSRAGERALSEAWSDALREGGDGSRVRLNEPYLGIDDGLTTHLRTLHDVRSYIGVEIEVRQGAIRLPDEELAMGRRLVSTLRAVCAR